ncbi:MAG TPA: PAC2 family protein [Dehalococcoidia bacterium]|nr:PAC2 family protein [Dehalococcoidia bacterium]
MERRGNVVFTEKPKLRQPYLVCGLNGWVDGGEAATGSIQYLVSKLGARRFAEIPIGRFHIFQVPGQLALRPQIKIEDGLLKEHHFPQNQFFYWQNPHSEHDLILFLGTEPNLNWEEYAEAIFSVVSEFGVARIYLLGGVLDKTPHTREPGVFCTLSSEALKEEMLRYRLALGNYEGPGSFGSTLLHLARARRLEMVNLIARATYYPEFNIVIPRNPKAIRAIVVRLNSLLRLHLDLADLERESEELELKLNFMASHNPKFQAYIEQLEKDFVEVKYEEPLDISPHEAVEIAEELLKKKEEDT